MFGIPVVLLLVGIILLFFTTVGGVITIISGLVCGSLIPILFYPCVYLITDSEVRIRYGLFEKQISFTEIEDVELSEDAWSSPALSLKRVKIKYRDTFTMVSPPNREEFMVVLKSKLP